MRMCTVLITSTKLAFAHYACKWPECSLLVLLHDYVPRVSYGDLICEIDFIIYRSMGALVELVHLLFR